MRSKALRATKNAIKNASPEKVKQAVSSSAKRAAKATRKVKDIPVGNGKTAQDVTKQVADVAGNYLQDNKHLQMINGLSQEFNTNVKAAGIGKTVFQGAVGGAAVGAAAGAMQGEDVWESAARGAVFGAGANTMRVGAGPMLTDERVTKMTQAAHGYTRSAKAMVENAKMNAMAIGALGLHKK